MTHIYIGNTGKIGLSNINCGSDILLNYEKTGKVITIFLPGIVPCVGDI